MTQRRAAGGAGRGAHATEYGSFGVPVPPLTAADATEVGERDHHCGRGSPISVAPAGMEGYRRGLGGTAAGRYAQPRVVTGAEVGSTTGERLRPIAARLGSLPFDQEACHVRTDVRAVRRRRRVHRVPLRPGGHRSGRADGRRRHPQRADRPARVAEADRQRELCVARGAAHHGHLALRQVRRGHDRAPLLRGCQNIDTVEQAAADHARALFDAPHAYVQPHSGIDANLVAFWAILAQRIESPALAKAGAKHVNDLTDEDWQTAAPRPRKPARTGHVAGRRRSPDARLPAEHQRQDVRAVVVRHRSRRPACSTTARCATRLASSSRWC